MDLVTTIYKLSNSFPKSETYGLTSQIRRAAVSIPANIAEGQRRSTKKDYRQFISIAFGSGSELETHLEIAKRLEFAPHEQFVTIDKSLDEIMRMLNRLMVVLSDKG